MIVSTLNIRGLGGGVKRRGVKELVRQNKVDFMAIQKTKMEVITDSYAVRFWHWFANTINKILQFNQIEDIWKICDIHWST